MVSVSLFFGFSVVSVAVPVSIVVKTVQSEATFFDMVVSLTSSKLNLVLLLNCLLVVLTNASNLLICCFFG